MSDNLISRFLQTGRNGVVVRGSAQSGKTTLLSGMLEAYALERVYRNSPKGNLAALRYKHPEVKVLNMSSSEELNIQRRV